MTASRASLAPIHRLSPRAVALAILGVALLGLLAFGAMQFATPQDDEARGVFEVALPPQQGVQRIRINDRDFWLVRDQNDGVHAIAVTGPFWASPVAFDPEPAEGSPLGTFVLVDRYRLDGPVIVGYPRLTRYQTEVRGAMVRIDLSTGALAR